MSAEAFEQTRPRLFGIAYRMLGSAADAEDVVQDTWLRWRTVTEDVENPSAYLATITTRLCLTALDSARARREAYVGPWLPEPVSTEDDPLFGAERAEALSLAVLLLLERLTATERAAYVLREAFDYSFREIASVLETTEANARQLATRARSHIDRERGAVVSPQARARLLAAFLGAAQLGDVAALESMLAEDAVSLSDGGGVVSAARKPVLGRVKVASFLLGLFAKYGTSVEAFAVEANGEPAVLVVRDAAPLVLWTFDVGPDGVRRMLAVLNPAKLGGFRAAALSHS